MESYLAIRKREMIHLRHAEKWSLQDIGDNFNISRERVRQIIGNTGFRTTKFKRTLHNPQWLADQTDKTNEEIAEITGACLGYVSQFRSGTRHAVKTNTNIHKGMEVEDWLSAELTQRGIENELMPVHYAFDILALETIRIEVKSAHKAVEAPSIKCISPAWGFKTGGRKRSKNADFYAFVIVPSKDVFIVPSQAINPKTTEIRFCWPTLRPTISKYQQYHNRYDLIGGIK